MSKNSENFNRADVDFPVALNADLQAIASDQEAAIGLEKSKEIREYRDGAVAEFVAALDDLPVSVEAKQIFVELCQKIAIDGDGFILNAQGPSMYNPIHFTEALDYKGQPGQEFSHSIEFSVEGYKGLQKSLERALGTIGIHLDARSEEHTSESSHLGISRMPSSA